MAESPTPSVIIHQDDISDKPDKTVLAKVQEINNQVAQFRYLLIKIGQSDDCPEMRVNIRTLRRSCVNAFKDTSKEILPRLQAETETGIPVDCPFLLLLFYVSQLFRRELSKSKNLIGKLPMDMTAYYESRSGPLSKIVFCKQMAPDFNQGELDSITKDLSEIRNIIDALQEFMPRRNANIGNNDILPYTIMEIEAAVQTLHVVQKIGNDMNNRRKFAAHFDSCVVQLDRITFESPRYQWLLEEQ